MSLACLRGTVWVPPRPSTPTRKSAGPAAKASPQADTVPLKGSRARDPAPRLSPRGPGPACHDGGLRVHRARATVTLGQGREIQPSHGSNRPATSSRVPWQQSAMQPAAWAPGQSSCWEPSVPRLRWFGHSWSQEPCVLPCLWLLPRGPDAALTPCELGQCIRSSHQQSPWRPQPFQEGLSWLMVPRPKPEMVAVTSQVTPCLGSDPDHGAGAAARPPGSCETPWCKAAGPSQLLQLPPATAGSRGLYQATSHAHNPHHRPKQDQAAVLTPPPSAARPCSAPQPPSAFKTLP